jgi:hypothetical protein
VRITHRLSALAAASGLLLVVGVLGGTFGALEAAAGGGPSGQNGFAQFTAFLNNLGTYMIWVGAAGGVLGVIASGGMLIAGHREGSTWLVRTVIGIGVILLAKGIFA